MLLWHRNPVVQRPREPDRNTAPQQFQERGHFGLIRAQRHRSPIVLLMSPPPPSHDNVWLSRKVSEGVEGRPLPRSLPEGIRPGTTPSPR